MVISRIIKIGIFLISSLPPSKLSDICKFDASNNLLIDGMAIGRLSNVAGTYMVEETNASATLLSWYHKGGRSPMTPDFFEGRVGLPVRADFYGGHVAFLIIPGKEEFRLNQEGIENIISRQTPPRTKNHHCIFLALLLVVNDIDSRNNI